MASFSETLGQQVRDVVFFAARLRQSAKHPPSTLKAIAATAGDESSALLQSRNEAILELKANLAGFWKAHDESLRLLTMVPKDLELDVSYRKDCGPGWITKLDDSIKVSGDALRFTLYVTNSDRDDISINFRQCLEEFEAEEITEALKTMKQIENGISRSGRRRDESIEAGDTTSIIEGPKRIPVKEDKAVVIKAILNEHHFPGGEWREVPAMNLQAIVTLMKNKPGYSKPNISRIFGQIFGEKGHEAYSEISNDPKAMRNLLGDDLPFLPRTDGNKSVSVVASRSGS